MTFVIGRPRRRARTPASLVDYSRLIFTYLI